MRKHKPIGQLSALPQDKKNLLRAWFDAYTYEEIVPMAREQFGITTNPHQLGRYYRRLQVDDVAEPPAGAQISIAQIIDEESLGKTEYTPATLKLVQKRAFHIALQPESDIRHIKDAFGILLRAERNQLDSRRLEIASERKDISRENLQFRKQNQSLALNPEQRVLSGPVT
jgi:hypothetical protein